MNPILLMRQLRFKGIEEPGLQSRPVWPQWLAFSSVPLASWCVCVHAHAAHLRSSTDLTPSLPSKLGPDTHFLLHGDNSAPALHVLSPTGTPSVIWLALRHPAHAAAPSLDSIRSTQHSRVYLLFCLVGISIRARFSLNSPFYRYDLCL